MLNMALIKSPENWVTFTLMVFLGVIFFNVVHVSLKGE